MGNAARTSEWTVYLVVELAREQVIGGIRAAFFVGDPEGVFARCRRCAWTLWPDIPRTASASTTRGHQGDPEAACQARARLRCFGRRGCALDGAPSGRTLGGVERSPGLAGRQEGGRGVRLRIDRICRRCLRGLRGAGVPRRDARALYLPVARTRLASRDLFPCRSFRFPSPAIPNATLI